MDFVFVKCALTKVLKPVFPMSAAIIILVMVISTSPFGRMAVKKISLPLMMSPIRKMK